MELVNFWQECCEEMFIHPEDEKYEEKLKNKGFVTDLCPIPYVGDIQNAKIIILMRNPSLEKTGDSCGKIEEPSQYKFERNPEMREALRRNLRQDFTDTQYPFVFLDPFILNDSFLGKHPGCDYWRKKFNPLIGMISKKGKYSKKDEIISILAKNIAVLQLVPYHSVGYKGEIHDELSSSIKAKKAFDVLSEDKNRLIIIPMGQKYWNVGLSREETLELGDYENIISYFNQGSYFSTTAKEKIITHLGL